MKNVPFHFRILMMMITIVGSLALPDDVIGQCNLCGFGSASGTDAVSAGAEVYGDYSGGFGRYTLIGALGSNADEAFGIGEVNISADQGYGFAYKSTVSGTEGFALGHRVFATATGSYVFGRGNISGLTNGQANSIMFGMNCDVPTMTITNSGGTSGDWGNVGIGTPYPATTLHVVSMDLDTVTDPIARLGIEGVTSSYIQLKNNEVTNGEFAASFSAPSNSDQKPALQFIGNNSVDGSGQADIPVIEFDARANNVTPTNRPLFYFRDPTAVRMAILNNGNVGIGTTAPMQALHIKAGSGVHTKVVIEKASTGSGMVNFNQGSTHHASVGINTVNNLVVDNYENNKDIVFSVNDGGTQTEVMRIDGNVSRVGIGTTTPSGKLHVNGTVFAVLSSQNTPGLNPVVYDNSTGELKEYTSTQNHKTQIENVAFDKEAFLSLRPVDFRWKDAFGGGQDVGLIAEEVEQLMPNMVNYSYKHTYVNSVTGEMLRDSLGNPVLDTTQLQPWGVDYRKISVYLLALAKEQDLLLDNLTNRLSNLESVVQSCCDAEPAYRIGTDEQSDHSTFEKASLNIYPNPNDGNFTIEYRLDEGESGQLFLVTVSGDKLLLSNNLRLVGKEDFNISGPSGVYQVILENNRGEILKNVKVVIAR